MTAQGHPRAIFQRAVERGNLVAAESTARELGSLTLEEALGLLFLYAEKEPIKFERAELRWLAQCLTEGKGRRRSRLVCARGASSWGARGHCEDAHGVGAASAVTR
jgi:hypothetical protein